MSSIQNKGTSEIKKIQWTSFFLPISDETSSIQNKGTSEIKKYSGRHSFFHLVNRRHILYTVGKHFCSSVAREILLIILHPLGLYFCFRKQKTELGYCILYGSDFTFFKFKKNPRIFTNFLKVKNRSKSLIFCLLSRERFKIF